MSNPQTTETTTNELYGAVKIEVSSDGISYVDCGAVNGAKLTEELTVSTLENQNAEDRERVTDQKAMIEFDMIEFLNVNARNIMRGSLDTIETTAGTPVTNHQQTIAATWTEKKFYKFDAEQYNGAVPTNISVVQSGGTTLSVNTDYFVIKNAFDEWGVYIVDNGTTNPALALTVEFDYTPAATTSYYTGGKSDLAEFYTRLTNVNDDGDIVRWTTLGKCTLAAGDEITYKKYNDADDRVSTPVKIRVRSDISLTAGKRLMVREVIPYV